MRWCAQEVDVSKLDAKCLMQRKRVPIKDDVTYFDNKNEAEGIYIQQRVRDYKVHVLVRPN